MEKFVFGMHYIPVLRLVMASPLACMNPRDTASCIPRVRPLIGSLYFPVFILNNPSLTALMYERGPIRDWDC